MRLIAAFALAAALALAAAPQRARADAIPMPETLSAEQALLIGVWQEEAYTYPEGLGHSFVFRTVAFANSDIAILTFSGVVPANMYVSTATRGRWRAERRDDTTLIVTLDQGEERGTELTLVFDGADSFTLQDAEWGRFPASRFRRVSAPVNPN